LIRTRTAERKVGIVTRTTWSSRKILESADLTGVVLKKKKRCGKREVLRWAATGQNGHHRPKKKTRRKDGGVIAETSLKTRRHWTKKKNCHNHATKN